VRAVAFSPDSKLVASSSWDHIIKLSDAASGALRQTLYIGGEAKNLKFSKCGPYLETDKGRFNIAPVYNCDFVRPQIQCEVSIEDNASWLALKRGKCLWLPPEYRPLCSAIHDDPLALGSGAGRVSFMKFTTDCGSGLLLFSGLY
jgi:WD40 repeat protein